MAKNYLSPINARGAVTTMSDTAPITPLDGEKWTDTVTGIEYQWYEDGTSGQWIGVESGQVTASVSAMPAYSTTETLTTERWTDGKPIYKKVLSLDFASTSVVTETAVVASNIDTVTDHSFRVVTSSSIHHKLDNYYNASAATSYCRAWMTDDHKVSIQAFNAVYYSKTVTIIVYYTKTTDTSASPVATIQALQRVVQSGEVLQVQFIKESSTPIVAGNTHSIAITPKSTDSTFILEYACCVRMDDATSQLLSYAQVDTVDLGDTITYSRSRIPELETDSPMGMDSYSNTTLIEKTFRIRTSVVTILTSQGPSSFKITEIQN